MISKRFLCVILLTSTTIASAAPTTQPNDEVIARVNGQPIYMHQIQEPMLDAYGLATLMNVVKLELIKQKAEAEGKKITEADVAAEREAFLKQLAPDAEKSDYNSVIEQILEQQRLSHLEFDMLIRSRAYLRKIAEPLIAPQLTDEKVQEYFNATYGETVRVRHIQCSNLQEIRAAQRKLADGESFAQVAKEVSRNVDTKDLGGEVPPFSRAAADVPQAFKDAAFALKVGEVSDPVSAGNVYHLIKLEERIPPKAVKFDAVKDAVKKDMSEKLMAQVQKQLLEQVVSQALAVLRIENPVIRKNYEAKIHARDTKIRDRDRLRQELEKSRPTTQPATKP